MTGQELTAGDAVVGRWCARWNRLGGLRSRPWVFVGATLAASCIPFVVGSVALRHPRYYPVGDLAEIEIRVRDVGTRHPPLIGLVGRLGTVGREGSHPGPLAFWTMWPFYRVFGGSWWALEVAVVAVHLIAIGVISWIAWRRGGPMLVLATAALLGVLLHAYGSSMLTQPWTPYVPLLWWCVFVFAIWSVRCGDVALLPIAVFAGSLCTQTHFGYAGLTAGLTLFALAGLFSLGRRDGSRVHTSRWIVGSVALLVVLWLPPLIEQLRYSPGNLGILWDYARHPPGRLNGFGSGLRVLLVHLNPWRILAHQLPATIPAPNDAARSVAEASLIPGLALLLVWIAAAITASRLHERTLRTLHQLIAVTLVLEYLSMSRLVGAPFFWLVLWAWTLTMIIVLAIAWTFGIIIRHRVPARASEAATRAARVGLAALTIAWVAWFTVDAPNVTLQGPQLSRQLRGLMPATLATLHDSRDHRTDRHGRFALTWTNPLTFDIPVWGILNELSRAGFVVGVDKTYRTRATPYHLIEPANATAVIHLAVGDDIDRWRRMPDATQIAYVGTDPQHRDDYVRLRAQVVRDLERAGLRDSVPVVDSAPLVLALDPRVPHRIREQLMQMLDIGLPTAIFIQPNVPRP